MLAKMPTGLVVDVAAVVLGTLAVMLASPVSAHTPQEVQALVERAVAHIRDVGRERALADFSRPDGGFVDGELYVYCDSADGTVIAHGGNPHLVGINLLDVRDPDGKLPNVEMRRIAFTQGSGWLEFRWPNPETRRIELKHAYVLKVDDSTMCGSGYYEQPSSP
jgi:cytochrome c